MRPQPEIAALEPDMIRWRRHVHQHPELSMEEHATQRFIRGELEAMGIERIQECAATGLVVRMGPASGPGVALRADTDALCMDENTGLSFASTNGAQHACGHDGHVAGLLAVAKALKPLEASLKRPVVLLFQPGEEKLKGAREMVHGGCLEGVTHVFGIHLWSTFPLGHAGISAGPVMANSDRLTVVVKGRGGHASMPQDARDPVPVAAAIVAQAQTVVSRSISATESGVVTFGGMRSSSHVANIIPEAVELLASIRSYREPVRETLERRLREICQGAAVAHQVEVDVDYRRCADAVVNDENAAQIARDSAAAVCTVSEAPKVLASEDFSHYQQPGVATCFFFVGAAIGDGVVRPHHSPEFDIDERAITCAASVFFQIVRDCCM